MSEFLTLVKCLPEILALIASIQKAFEDAKTELAVKEQLTQVKKAFDEKDSSHLDDLFNK